MSTLLMDVRNSFTKGQHWTNYLIVYIAYGMGGIMFFYLKQPPRIVFFLFLLFLCLIRKKQVGPELFWVLGAIAILFLIQRVEFGIGTFVNYLGIASQFLIGYLILKLLKEYFIHYFINVVYFFCFISLFFWLLTNVFPGFYDFYYNWAEKLGTDPSAPQESFIIYAVEPYAQLLGLRRNNGGFWEPGAYATTLVLALLLSVIKGSFKSNKSLVILLTIFTTGSTAAFAAVFFIMLIDLNLRQKRRNRAIYKTVVLIVLAIAFFSLDFLGPKIVEQYEYQTNVDLDSPTSGRFLGARKSLEGLSKHPAFGKGLVMNELTKDEDYVFETDLGIYGIFYLLERVGIIAFVLFIIIMYKGFDKIIYVSNRTRWNVFYGMMVWLVLMFSQALYWTPVSLYIFWVPLVMKNFNIKRRPVIIEKT